MSKLVLVLIFTHLSSFYLGIVTPLMIKMAFEKEED